MPGPPIAAGLLDGPLPRFAGPLDVPGCQQGEGPVRPALAKLFRPEPEELVRETALGVAQAFLCLTQQLAGRRRLQRKEFQARTGRLPPLLVNPDPLELACYLPRRGIHGQPGNAEWADEV